MSGRMLLRSAAISGFILVALGAFSTHALRSKLGPTELGWIQTGLTWQAYHTLAMLVLAVLLLWRPVRMFCWSGTLFSAGIILFSGSLYVQAWVHQPWLVYITPLGGICFLAGWVALLAGAGTLSDGGRGYE